MASQLQTQTSDIKLLKQHIIFQNDQLKRGRKHTRDMAYTQMLNAFLNVIKFARGIEPAAPTTRRNSKQFQRAADTAPMQQFLQVIYPGRKMTPMQVQVFFKRVDSLKDRRDRITHPRTIVELSSDVESFASMLEDHKNVGDVLGDEEILFLDVFSKIDGLRKCGIGNLKSH